MACEGNRLARPLGSRVMVSLRVLAYALIAGAFATPGCRGQRSPAPVRSRPVTFSKDIAPIVFEHCASCHRPGQLAPFSLITYAEVRNRAARIANVTAAREMPPWLPESGYAEFSNARRLRTDQLEILQAWATGGAIEGDPSDLPSLPTWSAGWQLGTPDLVVRLSKPYRLRPASSDIFRNFVIPIPLLATRYVRGVEFQPGSSAVVHHAVIGIDRTGTSRR